MAEQTPVESEAAATTGRSDAVEVVHAYFARIRARDAEIYRLFHPGAVLNGLGMQTRGREAIRNFYQRAIAEGGPQPRLVGSLLQDGPRIAAEIFIDLANGETLHVIDLFVVDQGLIRNLTYFLASEPRSMKGMNDGGHSENARGSDQIR